MAIDIIQLVAAILLIITILLQSRGTGLGAAFGGGDSVHQTKRGAEKGLYYITIILSIIFLGTALVNVIF